MAKAKPIFEEKLSITARGTLNITEGEEPTLETALGTKTLSEVLKKLNGCYIELSGNCEEKQEQE